MVCAMRVGGVMCLAQGSHGFQSSREWQLLESTRGEGGPCDYLGGSSGNEGTLEVCPTVAISHSSRIHILENILHEYAFQESLWCEFDVEKDLRCQVHSRLRRLVVR